MTNPKPDNLLREQLLRGSIGSFILIIGGTALSFLLNAALARLLGITQFGIYAYVITWVNILVAPSIFGMQTLLLRQTAAYHARLAYSHMRGILRWSLQLVLLAASTIALTTAIVTWLFHHNGQDAMLLAFWYAAPLIPILALILRQRAILHGLHCVIISQLPETIIRPIGIMVLVALLALLAPALLNAQHAMLLSVVASLIALLIGARLLGRALPVAVHQAAPQYDGRLWFRSALPLVMMQSLSLLDSRLAILVLGWLLNPTAVALYVVAERGASLITFVLGAANMALSPTVATLYAQGQHERLQQVVTRSIQLILLATLPLIIGLILLGSWFLVIFGEAFVAARSALIILVFGQIINVAMGSVGVLLTMTGHERDAAIGTAVSFALGALLQFICIPLWGLEGAALASTISIMVRNVVMAMQVHQRIGIASSIFGPVRWPVYHRPARS
ncbi:MAG: oligosaccharide flippase family protein [Chloroflexaceae bacterium]|nr:oligosaccharide flippase family protein [Chloroflexaceae bacterium]